MYFQIKPFISITADFRHQSPEINVVDYKISAVLISLIGVICTSIDNVTRGYAFGPFWDVVFYAVLIIFPLLFVGCFDVGRFKKFIFSILYILFEIIAVFLLQFIILLFFLERIGRLLC